MQERALTISAAICTYNRAHMVCEAIDSIFAQTRPPHEVIVVDDGSTDDTAEVLARYGKSLRYKHCPTNRGVAAARNVAVEIANGNWIAFLDSDDVWINTHLEEVTKLLEALPSLVWACSAGMEQEYPDVEPRCMSSKGAIDRLVSSAGLVEEYYRASASGVFFSTCGLVTRRDVIKRLGGFDPGLAHGEDLDMWWRIGREHPQIGFARRPGYVYRRFEHDSLTASHQTDNIALCKLVERHLELTQRVGRLDAYLPLAARKMEMIGYRALYADDVDVVRRIARRHWRILTPVRRVPIYLAALLPRRGRTLLRLAMRLRLHLLGRRPAQYVVGRVLTPRPGTAGRHRGPDVRHARSGRCSE